MKLILKQELEKRGLTKADLHRMSGVSKPTLTRIEAKGFEEANQTTIKAINDALLKFDEEQNKKNNTVLKQGNVMSEELNKYSTEIKTDALSVMRMRYHTATSEEEKNDILHGAKLVFGDRAEHWINKITKSQ